MPDPRDFLPPPPWERLPSNSGGSISEDDFYRHIAEKYRIRIPEGVIHLVEPITTAALSFEVASFCVRSRETRSMGMMMYITGQEDVEALARAGIVDVIVVRFIQQRLTSIERLLKIGDFNRAADLMDVLGIDLNLLATYWMASKAERT